MNDRDKARIAGLIFRHRAARWLQGLSLAGGVLAAPWHGLPSVLAGVVGAIFFHFAKPDPDERIDKLLK